MKTNRKRFTIYMTDEDKKRVKIRAATVARNMSDYLSELVMWDNRMKLIERLRNGEIKDATDQSVINR